MGDYSVAFGGIPLTATAARPLIDIRASATDYCRIKEISGSFFNVSTAATTLGVGIPATMGTVDTHGIWAAPQPLDPANWPSSPIVIGTAWTVMPTAPSKFFKRVSLNNTTSTYTQFDFIFRSGIQIAPGTSLVLWVVSTTATQTTMQVYDFNIEIDT